MICGRSVPFFRHLCARCKREFGFTDEFSGWPEWAKVLRRYEARRRAYERQMLAHYDRRDPDTLEHRLGDGLDLEALLEPEPTAVDVQMVRVREALLAVRPEWAEAFLLRAWRERTWAEAGQMVGLSGHGVRGRYLRAVEALREILGDGP